MTTFFVTKCLSKFLWASKSLSKISIICILWYDFLNDLNAQSDFDKSFVTKKLVKYNHSYFKYALRPDSIINQFNILWKRCPVSPTKSNIFKISLLCFSDTVLSTESIIIKTIRIPESYFTFLTNPISKAVCVQEQPNSLIWND